MERADNMESAFLLPVSVQDVQPSTPQKGPEEAVLIDLGTAQAELHDASEGGAALEESLPAPATSSTAQPPPARRQRGIIFKVVMAFLAPIIVLIPFVVVAVYFSLLTVSLGFSATVLLLHAANFAHPELLNYLPPFNIHRGDFHIYLRDGVIGAAVQGAAIALCVVLMFSVYSCMTRGARRAAAAAEPTADAANAPSGEGAAAASPGLKWSQTVHGKVGTWVLRIVAFGLEAAMIPLGSLIYAAACGGQKDVVADNLWFALAITIVGQVLRRGYSWLRLRGTKKPVALPTEGSEGESEKSMAEKLKAEFMV